MNKHSPQIGSTETVIVICLVLALVTALGWIFWQNFVHKEPNAMNTQQGSSQTVAKPKQDTPLNKEACVENYGDTMCFRYPDSWGLSYLDTYVGQDYQYSQVAIPNPRYVFHSAAVQSPDKKLILRLETGVSGVGGMCNPEASKSHLTTVSSDKLPVSTVVPDDMKPYHTDKFHAVQVINYVEQQGYSPDVYLTTDKTISSIGEHKPCEGMLSRVVMQRRGAEAHQAFTFSLDGVAGDESGQRSTIVTETTSEKAKLALQDTSFTQATNILKSFYYKNS